MMWKGEAEKKTVCGWVRNVLQMNIFRGGLLHLLGCEFFDHKSHCYWRHSRRWVGICNRCWHQPYMTIVIIIPRWLQFLELTSKRRGKTINMCFCRVWRWENQINFHFKFSFLFTLDFVPLCHPQKNIVWRRNECLSNLFIQDIFSLIHYLLGINV